MSFYERHTYDDGQFMFDRTTSVFVLVIKLLLKAVVYSPLLLLGGIIAKQILNEKANILIWIALIFVFAAMLYFVIYFLKGVMIALKVNRNLLWIPVFICCVIFTCALPMYIVFDPIQSIITRYTETNHDLLTWIFASAFGLYVYSKYHFLTNIAPIAAYPYYHRGIVVTNHLLNFSRGFKAKKSQEVF